MALNEFLEGKASFRIKRMKYRGKEYVVRVAIFNTNSLLSITTARRIVSASVILFVFQCIGAKDACIFAQTAEKELDIVSDEKSDQSQAKPGEGLPSVEPPAQPEPALISETVEPVVESWGSVKGFGEKIDWIHSNLYKIAKDQLATIDSWFNPLKGEQRIVVELSRFRVGVFGEGKIKKDEGLDFRPEAVLDSDIELPNMKRRIKLVITTIDPTTLPGKSITEQPDKSLRTAVESQWRHDVSASIGVRARWKPELYSNAVWSHAWKIGNWSLYPQQSFYWERG